MSRTRRSAEELIQEHEAKIAKLRTQAAMKDAKDSPGVSTLVNAITNIDRELLKISKGFGSGPQSFENRIKSHTLWVTEIEAEQEYANDLASALKAQKDELRETMESLLRDVTSSDITVTEEEAEAMAEEAIANASLNNTQGQELYDEWQSAKEARKEFSITKKLSKKQQLSVSLEEEI